RSKTTEAQCRLSRRLTSKYRAGGNKVEGLYRRGILLSRRGRDYAVGGGGSDSDQPPPPARCGQAPPNRLASGQLPRPDAPSYVQLPLRARKPRRPKGRSAPQHRSTTRQRLRKTPAASTADTHCSSAAD